MNRHVTSRPARERRIGTTLIAAAIVAATFLAYYPCWHGEWVWDDGLLLLHNPVLKPGGLLKVWMPPGYLNYWPLTYTAYWFGYHIWGLNPLGFHLLNIGWHAVASLLVWAVLRQLRVNGAALAAAIFALHPLNVESVALVAELKGDMSVVFVLVSLLAYLYYEQHGRRWGYIASIAAFIMAALSKGDSLTLPIVLLALSWWRSGRIERRHLLRILPYFVIVACMVVLEVWGQHIVGAQTVRSDGVVSRALVAGCAVWFYLWKFLWPVYLIPVYPRWQLPASGLLWCLPSIGLLGALAAAFWWRRTWGGTALLLIISYVALLLPALGFVNISYMEYSLVADHWQHIAMIVPCAALAAAIAAFTRSNHGHWIAGIGCAVLLTALWAATFRQSAFYAEPRAFYEMIIERDPNSWVAECNLGVVEAASGHIDAAAAHYRRALALNPSYAKANSNLGDILRGQGKLGPAMVHLNRALDATPNSPEVHVNYGLALLDSGDIDAATSHFKRALEIQDDVPAANFDLALALARQGEADLAISHLRREIEIDPNLALARENLRSALAIRGRAANRLASVRGQLRQSPSDPSSLKAAAWILATSPYASLRNGPESVDLAQRLWKLTGGDDPESMSVLAAAFAEVGRFDDAIRTARRARELAESADNTTLAALLSDFISRFIRGKPYRDLR